MSVAGAFFQTAPSTTVGDAFQTEGRLLHEPRGALRSVELSGPAGRLEGLLNEGAPDAPFAALLCHPHPVHGGNLHNKVVYRAMKVLNDPAWGFALPVLRFNFRGTGLSQGRHHGTDEAADVLAAMDWLQSEFRRPLVVGGFSFGAAMAFMACFGPRKGAHDVHAAVALGLPAHAAGREYHYGFLHSATAPMLFLSGDQDVFAPAAELEQVAALATGPTRLTLIPGADHFFTGQIEAMQKSLALWIQECCYDPHQ